jgi:hypothetical protein
MYIEQTIVDPKWVAVWIPRKLYNKIIYPSPGYWWDNHSYTGTKPAYWTHPGYVWVCGHHGPYLARLGRALYLGTPTYMRDHYDYLAMGSCQLGCCILTMA